MSEKDYCPGCGGDGADYRREGGIKYSSGPCPDCGGSGMFKDAQGNILSRYYRAPPEGEG